MNSMSELKLLKKRLIELEAENRQLKNEMNFKTIKKTVLVPDSFSSIFDIAEKNVADYFSEVYNSAENGEIEINNERYILIRSASLSYEFLDIIRELYSNNGEEEATVIGNNFLFDIGHVLGQKDAKAFHKKMNLTEPIEKLSAGPVHFAYTGWANVEILPESNPTPDDNFILKYHHHNSFEAQSWIKAKRKSDRPVCIMNSGYSSGWCAESFEIPLTAVEITCEAKGDSHCTFIMAPPHKIQEYLSEENQTNKHADYEIPVFFQRKATEDILRNSLVQKETLLKEVHHRVKNNLQIISSLFRLQLDSIQDPILKDVFFTGVNRVNTMANIHELIYSDPDLSSINIENYFRRALLNMLQVYERSDQEIKIDFDFQIKEGNFNPDKAIPLGLILNEIASNSFKHAFKDTGIFRLKLIEFEDTYELIISDNGPGLPENLDDSTLGMTLIHLLSEQLDAELIINNSSQGLSYNFRFQK